jgi:hypothetical protein
MPFFILRTPMYIVLKVVRSNHIQCHNVGEKIGDMGALTTLFPQNFVH